MKQGIVNALWFSPTGTTKKIVMEIASTVANDTRSILREFDITPSQKRMEELTFTREEVVVFGVPVYAGRVPNVILEYLYSIKGNGAKVIAVVLYGNRHFDNALIELDKILKQDGFYVVGAGAFIGEHSFSNTLAAGRPNELDFDKARELAKVASKRWQDEQKVEIKIPGDVTLLEYYKPQKKTGEAIDIRKVKPKVNENCNECGSCISLCPMGSIEKADVSKYQGICIKCGACIKGCPQQARYIDDEGYLYHKRELEEKYVDVKNSVLYID